LAPIYVYPGLSEDAFEFLWARFHFAFGPVCLQANKLTAGAIEAATNALPRYFRYKQSGVNMKPYRETMNQEALVISIKEKISEKLRASS
jgi:hypothetical protein